MFKWKKSLRYSSTSEEPKKHRGDEWEFRSDLRMCESLMRERPRENKMVSGGEREREREREGVDVCVLKCVFAWHCYGARRIYRELLLSRGELPAAVEREKEKELKEDDSCWPEAEYIHTQIQNTHTLTHSISYFMCCLPQSCISQLLLWWLLQ